MNIKVLHLKGSSHQSLCCFIGFLFLFSLSNPLFLSLIFSLAPPHPTLPLLVLFSFFFLLLLLFFLFCVGLVFVAFVYIYVGQNDATKGRVSSQATLRTALEIFCFRGVDIGAQHF